MVRLVRAPALLPGDDVGGVPVPPMVLGGARLVAGVVLPGATVQNDWVQVTLDGWIFATSIGPSTREGFDVAVTHAGEENMRAGPRGPVIARVPQGFGLAKTGEDGKWVHVRRDGWVRLTAVEPTAVAASIIGVVRRRSKPLECTAP